MSTPPVIHGSFTIERTYGVPPARVFAAWADIETKARWFIGPPGKWTLVERKLDFREGGSELLHGEVANGSTMFSARYHSIIPDRRLVYDYDMHLGGKHFSTSLATVELEAVGSGTRMTFTEYAAYYDGQDGTKSREHGTAAHLDRLAQVFGGERDIVSERVIDAPRERVFRAFTDPKQLPSWWGPKGFSNTFHEFDPTTGGRWRFVMHGPDGTDYPNESEFNEVVAPERIVFTHLEPMHRFEMTMTLAEEGGKTRLIWRMRFDSEAEAERVRSFVAEANQQNFDRLAAHLVAMANR